MRHINHFIEKVIAGGWEDEDRARVHNGEIPGSPSPAAGSLAGDTGTRPQPCRSPKGTETGVWESET
jgi:hypothetical protein